MKRRVIGLLLVILSIIIIFLSIALAKSFEKDIYKRISEFENPQVTGITEINRTEEISNQPIAGFSMSSYARWSLEQPRFYGTIYKYDTDYGIFGELKILGLTLPLEIAGISFKSFHMIWTSITITVFLTGMTLIILPKKKEQKNEIEKDSMEHY